MYTYLMLVLKQKFKRHIANKLKDSITSWLWVDKLFLCTDRLNSEINLLQKASIDLDLKRVRQEQALQVLQGQMKQQFLNTDTMCGEISKLSERLAAASHLAVEFGDTDKVIVLSSLNGGLVKIIDTCFKSEPEYKAFVDNIKFRYDMSSTTIQKRSIK